MQKIRTLGAKKVIAMVAHDNKKKDIIEWAEYNKSALSYHELVGTGTTGKMLEEQLGRPVKKLLSGPLGGDQQIGSMIAEGKIDALIFIALSIFLATTPAATKQTVSLPLKCPLPR